MLEITQVTIRPNLPLIGKDLDAGATFNADVNADMPDLMAGTVMLFTPGAGATALEMIKAPLPIPANGMLGILAADSYQTFTGGAAPATINRPAMIYRRGVFIRSTVNAINAGEAPDIVQAPPPANQWAAPILPGDINDLALSDAGIFLEESWDENRF